MKLTQPSLNDSLRSVVLNLPNPNFCSNQVLTARYNLFSWLPKSLLYQLSRVTNVYYIIVTGLLFFPFSPELPWPALSVLVAVFLFTSIKEGIEDISRHKQDRQVNRSKCFKLDQKSLNYIEILSEDVQVGDILKVSEDCSIPADLILLKSSNKGLAYLNTMNLDGETNLKERFAIHSTQKLESDEELAVYQAEFQADTPSENLVRWNCNIINKEGTQPLSIKQLLLRGCVLKNTSWIKGVVIYSGVDCKVVLSSNKSSIKISPMQGQLSRIIYSIMIFMLALSLLLGGLGKNWKDNNSGSRAYIPEDDYSSGEVLVNALRYWLLLTWFIPFTIFVDLEVLRLILSWFITKDIMMYDETVDRPANWRDSSLIENLGQVEFVFTDKTGTLTRNEMQLYAFSLPDASYKLSSITDLTAIHNKISAKNSLDTFFHAILLCNSIFTTLVNNKITYHSISPDEIALAEGLKQFGYFIIERTERSVRLKVGEKEENWLVEAEVPFTPERKRMVSVVREIEGKAWVIVKGADCVVKEMIGAAESAASEIKEFAEGGLRTLMVAGRWLEEEEYDYWIHQYQEVMLSNSTDKENMIDKVSAHIETDLNFIAVTAVEDKLQVEVPETISLLLEANMKIWMLTGDKEETALEIAHSCGLFSKTTELIDFSLLKHDEILPRLSILSEKYSLRSSSFEFLKSQVMNISIAVNGSSFSLINSDKNSASDFLKLGMISKVCICSRMSPAQKSEVVKLCRSAGRWITLSIGDGANDVSMLKAAHLGIGIAGKEGNQACLASEYSITQFRHLKYLLFVHGRYSYQRLSLYIIFFLYKNFLHPLCQLWLAFWSGYSGQIYFLDWIPSFYNLFWTSWPSLAFFTLEQDISPAMCLRFPGLYGAGQKNLNFNLKVFWRWVMFAAFSATVAFWIPMGAMSAAGSDGKVPGLFWLSTSSFCIIIFTVNLKFLIISRFWTKINILSIFVSLFFFFLTLLILNMNSVAFEFQPEFPGMVLELLNTTSWIPILLGALISVIPDFLYEVIKSIYFPSASDKAIAYCNSVSKNQVSDNSN